MQRNKRDLSQTESNSNETIDDENNGGEVNSAEQPDTNEFSFNNETTRNKTYFYPKFVNILDISMHFAIFIYVNFRMRKILSQSESLMWKWTKRMIK